MAERFKARDGVRVPLPSGGDWPAEGRAVNFANPFEARLVREGSLVPVDEGGDSAAAPADADDDAKAAGALAPAAKDEPKSRRGGNRRD